MGRAPDFRTEVEVFGTTEAADRMRLVGMRATNTAPVMVVVREMLFEQQKSRAEKMPWAPLADNTVERKVAQDEDPTLMHGEWRSIGGQATRVANKLWLALTLRGATGQIMRSTRTTATFGLDAAGNNQLFYARFVQDVKGTKRQLLGISAEDAMEITERISRWLYDGIGGLRR